MRNAKNRLELGKNVNEAEEQYHMSASFFQRANGDMENESTLPYLLSVEPLRQPPSLPLTVDKIGHICSCSAAFCFWASGLLCSHPAKSVITFCWNVTRVFHYLPLLYQPLPSCPVRVIPEPCCVLKSQVATISTWSGLTCDLE